MTNLNGCGQNWSLKQTKTKKQKYMLLIAGWKLNALWTCTSFFEPGSTTKSTHDGKHSLSKKDFPNTAELWDYCLQLKLFFSSVVNQSYPQGDSDGLLSSPSPKRNWVSTVWIRLSIVFAYNWNNTEEKAKCTSRMTFATVSFQKKPPSAWKLKPSNRRKLLSRIAG